MKQVISLGMGVQSTALYLMSSMGQLPRADYAIFSDLGRESTATYKYLDFLFDWKERNNGIPIIRCSKKNLFLDLLLKNDHGRFTSIPAFVRNDDGAVGMLKRQCTAEYKIQAVDDYIRDHIYELPKYARRPLTAVWHGITLDEADRLSTPREAWKINLYPFLGRSVAHNEQLEKISWARPMTRQEVIRWYLLHGLPVPPKSACVFCPYHSDISWAMLKKQAPEDFAAAVQVDHAIRNSTSKGIHNPVYLHRSCRPLETVVFNDQEEKEFAECSGHCHV